METISGDDGERIRGPIKLKCIFFLYKIPFFFTLTGPLMTTYISSVMLMMIMIAMTMMTIITNVMMMAMTIKNYSLTLMFAESDSD